MISNFIICQRYFVILSHYNYFIIQDVNGSYIIGVGFHIVVSAFIELQLLVLHANWTVFFPIAEVLVVTLFLE